MWTPFVTLARALAASAAGQPDDYDDVRAMARRQFKVSVIVGLAALGAAALIFVCSPRPAPTGATAQHRIMPPEAPRLDTAQPTAGRSPRG
jgi:predicted secreted protein